MKNLIKRVGRSFLHLWVRLKTEYNISVLTSQFLYKGKLKQLKNIHKGERCFVIGNGPSLTSSDLDLIKDEFSFAANRVFYIFEKTKWRPTYYCAQDTEVVKDIANTLDVMIDNSTMLFIISICRSFIPKRIRDNNKVLFFRAKFVNAYDDRLFSNKIENYIFGGGSVTYASIQLAAYMGFSEIYLLGVDHNYNSASFSNGHLDSEDVKNSYFEGMPSNIVMNAPNTDNSTLSFIKAKEWADANGIKIMNATRGGKLEVFPRIRLEDIIKK